MRFYVTIFFFLAFSNIHAQTLGGNTAYNFLKLSYTPALTAAGGVNISHQPNDVALALNNPALLNPLLHAQLALNFTALPAGVTAYQLAGAAYNSKSNTTLGAQICFVDYGQIQAADAAGNLMGHFRATDYLVQLSAGRQYLQKWRYGASVKIIHSSYEVFRSTALALDVGIHYFDSTNGFSFAVLAKNMGSQLKTYAGEFEELPFDLELGLTKKLVHAPFAFSLTVQQMQHFNLFYNDTDFNAETDVSQTNSFFNNAFQHVVFATHIFISKQLEATIGYNHLRRSELSLGTAGNGLSGFSAGVTARFEKLQVSYARSTYQRGISYNQFGLILLLNTLVGAGKF